MAKRRNSFTAAVPMIEDAEFVRVMQEHVSGVDPRGRGREAPAPTRTTSHPFAETNQRKPYMPVSDTSTPALDEGISFRQSID